jgi:DNA polymerase-3 subunit beta
MKLTSSIRQLQDAVSKVTQAIPVKTIDPRFENVHLTIESGSLTLYATDGELSITAKSDVDTTDTGNIGIKAKTLQDFLRSMYDTTVTFVIERQEISDHGTVLITTDKGRYKIPCQFESKQEKYEKIYDISLELATTELQDLIHKTIFACSVDGMRPAMTDWSGAERAHLLTLQKSRKLLFLREFSRSYKNWLSTKPLQ